MQKELLKTPLKERYMLKNMLESNMFENNMSKNNMLENNMLENNQPPTSWCLTGGGS